MDIDISELSNTQKESLLPPLRSTLTVGNHVFKVSYRNIGKLRITLELHSIISPPAPSVIIDPRSEEGQAVLAQTNSIILGE